MVFGEDEKADRETCLKKGIHYCEPGNPWKPRDKGRAYHPYARELDDSQEDGWPSGDTIRTGCPVCGHTWTEELPQ